MKAKRATDSIVGAIGGVSRIDWQNYFVLEVYVLHNCVYLLHYS